MPPCPTDLTETGDAGGGGSDSSDRPAQVTRSQNERLIPVCRDYTNAYQELQEKYHEIIYSTAEKVLRNSQANQMKQLKTCLEKETNDVMRQLNLVRRSEVKALALVHRDRDELVRMKREVASSLVERGVAERVRLTQAYEKKKAELQKQHDLVKAALNDHKAKVIFYSCSSPFSTFVSRLNLFSLFRRPRLCWRKNAIPRHASLPKDF